MAFQAGSVTAIFQAKIDDFVNKMKGAGKSLENFGSKGKRLEDQLKSLEKRKQLVIDKMNMLERAGQKGNFAYRNLSNQLASYSDRINTHNIKASEFLAKQNQMSQKSSFLNSVLGGVGLAFSKLGGVAGSVGSAVLGSLTRIGEYIAGNLIANGIGKITNAFVEFGKSAFNSVFNLQDMRGGFEAMLGSADKAKKLLTDLSEYNKKTPFELPDLQEQAGNLLAIGVAVDDLIPTMDTLGKISRGNSQRFGFLALAFGQVKTATKLTGAELRQFTENGVPLLELLAQQTGKTTAQMREDISDGAVSFDMVDRALKSTVQEGGRFYNYFERNSNNFSYVLSNLKDSAMQMGRSILGISESGDILNGSIADLSMQGLQNLLTFVNNNKEAIIDFVKNGIQVGINAFNDFRLNVLPGIILKLQELQAWWQGEGGQAVRDFVSNVWNKVVEGFEKLKNDVIPPLLTEISKISDKFKEITKWYEDNKAWVDNLAILLGGIAAGFALVSLALGVYAVVIGIATAVSTAFAAVMAFIASPFFLIALAIGVVIAIGVLLWKNWDWLGQQAQNIWNFISSVFMSAMSAIGTFFSNFWVWLTVSPQEWGYRIGFLIGSVIKFFIDSWNAVFAFSNWLWAMIVDFAIRSFVGLVAFIINFPNLIKFYFEIAKHWAISTFIQIAIWAINKFNEIKKTITDTFEAIKKINLLEVGKNVIDGLIKGITSMQNKVNETVKGVADGVAKGFKDALQIKSPSRVMMEAGVNVGEGVSIGIEKSLPMIAQSSNNMATETVQPMQNVTTTINNQKTYNQNIYGSGGGAGFLNLANQY